MEINIRLEKKCDQRKVEELTRQAFYRQERVKELGIGCDEHYLLHTLRLSKDYIKELNFVAESNGEIVGHVIYSNAKIVCKDHSTKEVITFGPLSVLPEYQKLGIGSKLMTHSIQVAKDLAYGGIVFFGHPTYYPRFGFVEAKEFSITTEDGKNYPAFMAMELKDGYFNKAGRFYESPLFKVNKEEAIEYDKKFTT